MEITFSRKILLGFIACVLILFGVAIFTFKNSEKFVASNALINHTNQVLYEFEQILVASIDGETGIRGFVITGDDNFLEPYLNANAKGFEHLNKVKELTKDNLNQQKNIEELQKEFKKQNSFFNRCIELRKKDFAIAKEFVASGEGKRIEDRIREIIDRAQGIEHPLIAERKKTSDSDAGTFNVVFAILLLIIVVILIIVYNIVTTNLRALERAEAETVSKNWLLTGNSKLSEKLIGVQRIEELATNSISFLCTYLKANIGAVYIFNDKDNTLVLRGQYAFASPKEVKEKFTINEGLIGQAAREQKPISLTDITEEHIRITSSVLNAKPKHLLITPFLFEGKTLGVIEIGSLTNFSKTQTEFINVSMDIIAISVNSAIDRKQILELLEETQIQSEEKEKRAAELAIANNELAYQNDEKEKRAAELRIAIKELAFQND